MLDPLKAKKKVCVEGCVRLIDVLPDVPPVVQLDLCLEVHLEVLSHPKPSYPT